MSRISDLYIFLQKTNRNEVLVDLKIKKNDKNNYIIESEFLTNFFENIICTRVAILYVSMRNFARCSMNEL